MQAATFMSGNMRGTMPWMAPELFPVMTSMHNSGVMVSHLLPLYQSVTNYPGHHFSNTLVRVVKFGDKVQGWDVGDSSVSNFLPD